MLSYLFSKKGKKNVSSETWTHNCGLHIMSFGRWAAVHIVLREFNNKPSVSLQVWFGRVVWTQILFLPSQGRKAVFEDHRLK